MAVREIVLLGDPVLRKPAADVDVFDDALADLVQDMFETMYHAEGVGLAAPQIGVSKRILVADVRARENGQTGQIALINPKIVFFSERTERDPEGCLSIPGVDELVERSWSIEVKAQTVEGKPVHIEVDALLARCLQHEIDHLDGILFIDRVSPLKRKMLLSKYRKLREEAEKESGGAAVEPR
jgi:peptide deformylase